MLKITVLVVAFLVQILGLVAACAAGGVESSGSHNHGDSSGWHAPALDYSNLAGNGHVLAGISQNYQALSHGQEPTGGHTFEHDVSQPVHDLGQYTGHGYDLGNQGQPKSFDVGSHNAYPSFAASGHDFTGDTYLQAAHDFGNHDHGVYNVHAGDLNSQSGNDHDDSNSHSDSGESNGHSDESHGQAGSAGDAPSGPAHGDARSFILHDGGNEYGHGGQGATVHDLGVQGWPGHDFGGHTQAFAEGLDNAEPFTVGEHTDEQKPVEVPLYKHVTVPVQKLVHVNVPKPILVGIPQPYPVKVPINKPVAVPVETEISIPIEKVVPYPVVKHVPYPVEKHVPFKVEKTVHVHVPQPYPVKVPIYKTIHHHKDH